MQAIELRYLDITWQNETQVQSITPSDHAIDISQSDTGWQAQTVSFPKVGHFIGLRFIKGKAAHTPFFRLADGKEVPLMAVRVPGSREVWWIEHGVWLADARRYVSHIYRSVGRIELVVNREPLMIQNDALHFSVAELEYFLADFKSQLWQLIVAPDSLIKGQVAQQAVPTCFDTGMMALVAHFLQCVDNILAAPHIVLKETQGKVVARNVRPVTRTFREYAMRPNARLLTGRVFIESEDTAENRYVHHCVRTVLFAVRGMHRMAAHFVEQLNRRLAHEQYHLRLMSGRRQKKVSQQVFDNELSTMRRHIEWYERQFLGGDVACDSEESEYLLKLGQPYAYEENAFFLTEINGQTKQTLGTYVVLELPALPEKFHSNGEQLRLRGYVKKSKEYNQNGNYYYRLRFVCVTQAECVGMRAKLAQMQAQREQLSANGWMAALSREESDTQERECTTMRGKIAALTRDVGLLADFSAQAEPLIRRLQHQLTMFKQRGIGISTVYPASMLFVQNPIYVALYNAFCAIEQREGMDGRHVSLLMQIDEIGLVNVAQLYERWCLLQIIDIITTVYGFAPEAQWQTALVQAVVSGQRNISLQFISAVRQQRIILTYEKVLSSGKRPDFVLDLYGHDYDLDKVEQLWYQKDERLLQRLVLDAKFRGKMREVDMQTLVHSLYHGKNYSENGQNRVFILHSVPLVIDERTSPLAWGRYCDYGQVPDARHRYGHIFLSPSLKHPDSLHNLQRLIAMFLQEQAVFLRSKHGLQWQNHGCIGCGNTDVGQLDIRYEPTRGGHNRWVIYCKSCGLISVKTVCFKCTSVPLYKNGYRWTYQRSRAEQMTNIVCPKCGSFL